MTTTGQPQAPLVRSVAGKRIQRRVKRLIDIGVAGVSLVIVGPIMPLVALLVLAGMGRPVLFRQVRLGQGGRPFVLSKFRTMVQVVDARGVPLPDGSRLTRLGRLLRRTSLDELPQLVHVLRGQMSLVGPRPLLPEYRDRYTPEEWRRHEVPPGLAGPAAAYGRNALSWERKLALDVWYVDNWSLRLDLHLLVKSLVRVVLMQGTSAQGNVTMPVFTGRAQPPEGDR